MTLSGHYAIEVNLEKASGLDSLSQETCMDGRSDCVGETRMDHNISPKQRKRAAEVDAAAYFFANAFHPAEGRGVSLPRSIPPLLINQGEGIFFRRSFALMDAG